MQDQNKNNMNDILSGPVFDFLVNESVSSKEVWSYNGGMIDGRSERNLNNSRIGVNYMSDVIKMINPTNILETGTNYGSFSYVCYSNLENFNLHTCDLVADSERCVSFINNNFGKDCVKFYNQHSWTFLRSMKESDIHFDMAWLDSTHTYDYLLQEMEYVAEMGVPYIVVDDFSWVRGIQLAVFDFLKKYVNYTFYSYSNNNADIGSIVVLKKID